MIRLSVRKTLGVNTPPWHSSASQRPNERGDHPRRTADKDVVGRQPRNKTDELTGPQRVGSAATHDVMNNGPPARGKLVELIPEHHVRPDRCPVHEGQFPGSGR